MNDLKPILDSSGVAKETQLMVSNTLEQFFQKTAEWSQVAAGIVITSPDEVGKMKMAREGRLTLKNIRLDCEKLVKSRREVIKARMATDLQEDKLWLKAGQLIETTFKTLESQFEEKEKFKEIWEANEKRRLKELREKRIEETPGISKFIPRSTDLSSLSEIEFETLIESAQKQVEDEDRKEKERIAQDLADKEEKQRLENELKEAREKLAAIKTPISETKSEVPTIVEPSPAKEIPSIAPSESDTDLLAGYIAKIRSVSLPKLSNPFESSKIEMELVVFTKRLEVILKDLP